MRAKAKKRTLRLSLLIGAAIVAVFVIVAVAGRFVLDTDDDGPAVPTDGVVTTELAPAQDDPVSDDAVTDEPTESVVDGDG